MALKDKENRTIVLPIEESIYDTFVGDNKIGHVILSNLIRESPELFPPDILDGYIFYGRTRISKKLNLRMRRIKIKDTIYRLRPGFVLPYCRAKTGEASAGLLLLKFGVPFWALAYIFGRNAMWWYRLYLCLGQNSIVGTTIKDPANLPKDILADEHHIRRRGNKAYVATVVGANCLLGMEVSPKADEVSLQGAYAVFKEEAQDLWPAYQPDTVNTDGWQATQNAWKSLFPNIVVIECFLHAFLKVRDRATKKIKPYFKEASGKIWNCYRACSKRQLAQQIRRLKEWASDKLPESVMRENVLKLCKKKNRWMQHFDYPQAFRTSNMLDRLMRAMKKHAFNSQMFHAKTISKTSMNFRAFALLYNFTPSCPAAWDESKTLKSPAARLNGFVYHDDWLQNLLISASLRGFRHRRNPL